MPLISRASINANSDDDHYEVYMERQKRLMKTDTVRNYNSIPVGSAVVAQ